MGGLNPFKSPKISTPDPVTPPAPPATTDAAAAADAEADRLRRRRGTAATIIAGDTAVVPQSSVATKTLLGQ